MEWIRQSWRDRYNRITIKRKLTIPLVAIVLLVFLLLGGTQAVNRKFAAEIEVRDKLQSSSRLASLVYANALWNYNYESMEDIADAMMLDSEIGLIEVRSFAGREIYARRAEGEAYERRFMSRVESPVVYQGQPIGIVAVGATVYYRQQELQRELLQSALFLLLTLGALAAVIDRVVRSVVLPIRELERNTEELAQGNLQHRIQVTAEDEIGRLAGKFNAMADSLSEMMEERQAAQEALETSEEKYGKAFKNLSEVVGLVRVADQRFIEVNDFFFEMLGYSPEEVIGHSSREFGLWVDDSERQGFFDRLLAEGAVREYECRWITKQGQYRIGLASAEIITVGGELYDIFIWNDITESRRAEDALRAARDQLELKVEERTSELMALNQELMAMNDELVSTLDRLKRTQQLLLHAEKMAALGSLVAGISHEISTPIGISVTGISYVEKELGAICAKLDAGTLSRGEFNEFVRDSAEMIRTTAKNLERADLLIRSFKQISVDQTSEEMRRFRVREYLEELLLSLNPLLKSGRYQVEVQCPEDLEITSYPGVLAQVLTNFITNSIRHGYAPGEGGHIGIQMDRFGALYTLNYRDDGQGMTPEVLERIYEPFFTTKRGAEGGTGLGLHLVYNIVTQKLGGEIKCFSEPGKGVSFVVTFPDLYGDWGVQGEASRDGSEER